MRIERTKFGGGVRAIALSMASFVATPAAWMVGGWLAHRSNASRQEPEEDDSRGSRRSSTNRTSAAAVGLVDFGEEGGLESGVPIVLLPDVGAFDDALEFSGLYEVLRKDRPIVAYDFPGNTSFATRSRREDYVRAVEEILEEAWTRYGQAVDVVTSGLTCELVAAAVSRSPGRVRSIVMLAPSGFEEETSATRFVRHRLQSLALRWLHAPLVGSALGRVLRARALQTSGDPHVRSRTIHERIRGLHAHSRSGARARALSRMACLAESGNVVEEIYDVLTLPVLLVHGDACSKTFPRMNAFTGRANSFRRVRVDGTHEAPHVEEPAKTAQVVTTFHRSLSARPKLRVIRGQRLGRPNAPRAHLHVAHAHA